MKISKLFHWLYFIVMMLPIFTIPVFAIYSHRHTIDSYSVQVQETKVVNFNQIFRRNTYSVTNNGVTVSFYDNYYINVFGTASSDFYLTSYSSGGNSLIANHVYVFRCLDLPQFVNVQHNYRTINNTDAGASIKYTDVFDSVIFTNYYDTLASFYVFDNPTVNYEFANVVIKPQLFDLTQMFGSGNEPTLEQFNNWYPNDYYDYTIGRKELLKTGNYITYNDTDIGSQFTYDAYNVVDKYFNYDNVFNFNQLYDWLNMTFFNGVASLGFFIFWHLLIYWLLTSILWLVFDVLMYVPQLVHRWLDKASLS